MCSIDCKSEYLPSFTVNREVGKVIQPNMTCCFTFKDLLSIILFTVFLIFFGGPSIGHYLRGEYVMVTKIAKTEDGKDIPEPSITVMKADNVDLFHYSQEVTLMSSSVYVNN